MPRQGSTKKAGCNPGAGERVTSTCDVRVETKKQHTGTEVSESSRSRFARRPKALRVFDHDLDDTIRDYLIKQDSISLDTETDGLDPRKDALRIVTICTPDSKVFVVRNPDGTSSNLQLALTDGFAVKIFHHAAFDLQFIKTGLGIDVRGPVECTKTLMKILRPDLPSGLGNALKHILKVKINKKINHKEWKLENLSARQKEYIADDTLYLHPLMKELKRDARYGALRRYADAMTVIRLKASIEMEGYIDLFTYEQAKSVDSIEKREWWAHRHFTASEIFAQGGKSCSNRHLA
jgi:ribonuclease D